MDLRVARTKYTFLGRISSAVFLGDSLLCWWVETLSNVKQNVLQILRNNQIVVLGPCLQSNLLSDHSKRSLESQKDFTAVSGLMLPLQVPNCVEGRIGAQPDESDTICTSKGSFRSQRLQWNPFWLSNDLLLWSESKLLSKQGPDTAFCFSKA